MSTPHATGTVVVAGDGGLLTFGLAYFLKRGGWENVVLVGEERPHESAHIQGVVDVHPPRVHRRENTASLFQHVWFGALQKMLKTATPPQRIEINQGAYWNPLFWNWGVRMLFCTRETQLDVADIHHAKLLQGQQKIYEDMAAELSPGPLKRISANVTDLFFDRGSFAVQRFLLVSLAKEKLKYDLIGSKGKTNTGDHYPTLYRAKQHIRGALEYSSCPQFHMSSLSARLAEYCTQKWGTQIKRIPSNVTSFNLASEGAKRVEAVVLENGEVVACDAVVLANGGGIVSLLHKAGCYLLPPLYEGTAYSMDVDTTREYRTGGIPDRSLNLEHDIFITREDGTDKARISGMITFGDYENTPSFKETESAELKKSVYTRFCNQLDKYCLIEKMHIDEEATYVDAMSLTADSVPLIGRIREKGRFLTRPNNVYVCGGLGQSGVHIALSSAKLLSEISTGGTPSLAEHFSPERFWLSA